MYNEPKKYTGAWNFGPHISSIKTVKDLSEKVIAVFGKGKIKLDVDPNANHEASILHLNCDKSNTKLQWYPTWNFDETIEKTVNWYLGQKKEESAESLTKSDINNFLKQSK